jgi:hypothetical protein
MWRKLLAPVLALAILALPLAATAQGYPVYDNLQYILQSTSWGQQFAQWTTQLARMLQQYNQLVTTYTYMQHLAKQLEHPDTYTVLSLFAITPSSQLTQVQNIGNFRQMVEGTLSYSNNLGQLYHRIYGQPITNVNNITPSGATDWTTAATHINDMVQANDAAILALDAVTSKTNQSFTQLNDDGTYTTLANQIKNASSTPEQTAQAGALSSLYAAQSVDKLTQVMTASAQVQAAQAAQANAATKASLAQAKLELDYQKRSGEASRNDDAIVSSWQQIP